jgi:hypothetical protein
MNIFIRLGLFIIIISVLYAITVYIEIPYNINTRGVVMPVREWRLVRLPDGTILNTEKNNLTNKITYYSVLEFQRGDHAEFIINDRVFSGKTVNEGDTIGFIRSYEEERRLLGLLTGLEEQRGLLRVHLSGGKREEVDAYRERYILAEKEYETQKKLLARMESLHQEGIIADEAWELALNDYEVKKQNVSIARSSVDVISAGAKDEELDLIRTNINSFQRQIEQTNNRIEAFNILAPFSGNIIRQQAPELDNESIIRVADLQNMIITLPVELYQLDYIDNGNEVRVKMNPGRRVYKAKIVDVDNTVQFMDQRQNVFITALVEEEVDRFMPNMLVEAEIICGQVPAIDYIRRLFRIIFVN